jgi:hypothetical protein
MKVTKPSMERITVRFKVVGPSLIPAPPGHWDRHCSFLSASMKITSKANLFRGGLLFFTSEFHNRFVPVILSAIG